MKSKNGGTDIIAERLLDRPMIESAMDQRMGNNINGPSLIKVPPWVRKPLGRYYLYFAHHMGRYIRMAYANEVIGPWTVHTPGVLDLNHSLFECNDIPDGTNDLLGDYLYAHIASPDVHIDTQHKRVLMYYHGLLPNADQQTRLAYSEDGLSFFPHKPLLGPAYFRAFKYNDYIYVISWAGVLLRSNSWYGPFEQGPALAGITTNDFPHRILRHAAVFVKNNHLHLFFSCIGDTPEHIQHTMIDLDIDWRSWHAGRIDSILFPQRKWEGVDLAVVKSEEGAALKPCHALRDPCIYADESSVFLLYCGAGESGGIGLTTLNISPN